MLNIEQLRFSYVIINGIVDVDCCDSFRLFFVLSLSVVVVVVSSSIFTLYLMLI